MDYMNKSTFSTRQLDSLKEDNENEALKADFAVNNEINNSAKFDSLIDSVLTSFTEVQSSVQDLLQLKDDLLLHFLPPPLLFRIAVTCGRVYRVFSDLNTPVTELLRLVKIYSASWEKNSAILKKLHDMYENKKQMLNIAIKRLALVDKRTKFFAREKRILNWEKLFIKLSEAKGHGRRWKFQMDSFRKKSEQGYDELVKWILREAPDHTEEEQEESQSGSKKKRKDKHKDKNRDDGFEASNISLEMKSSFSEDNDNKKGNDENYMHEVDSDQDIFSERSSVLGGRRRKQQMQQAKDVAEANTQTEPDVEDKAIWTGEPDYKRFLIVRVFKPIEFNNKRIKFKVTYGETNFVSHYFEPSKAEKRVKIVETPKSKRSSMKSNIRKDSDTNESSLSLNDKTDINKYEDFLFEMTDYFKRKDGLSTTTDNCVSLEMILEEKDKQETVAHSNIQMEDIHTLDLPILYYRVNEDAQVIDFYEAEAKNSFISFASSSANVDLKKRGSISSESAASWLRINDLTYESAEKYDLLSKRSPFSFDMYKTNSVKSGASVCKLPLMFFWIRKPSTSTYSKNTGTQSIRDIVKDLTGFDIENQTKNDISRIIEKKEVETDDKCTSPLMRISSAPQERPPSTPLGSIKSKSFDTKSKSDIVNNDEIQAMQENYQLQIDQLNLTIFKLENENLQLKALNDLKSTDVNKNVRFKNNRMPPLKQNDTKLINAASRSTEKLKEKANQDNDRPPQVKQVWTKDLTDDFLERLKQFADKSNAHHREIINKYVMEEANIREQQMAVQHRLDLQGANGDKFEDFCLPAVFMPYKSPSNVYNPRAHQYFHPSGSTDVRLTQPPTVFQLPPLPSRSSLSVINLFELGKRYEAGEPDFYINQYINSTMAKISEENKKPKQANLTTDQNAIKKDIINNDEQNIMNSNNNNGLLDEIDKNQPILINDNDSNL